MSPKARVGWSAFLKRWGPPLVWMGLIFLFSMESFSYQKTGRFLLPLLGWLFPWASLEGLAFVYAALRKISHPLEYMILSFLWARALAAPSLPSHQHLSPDFTTSGCLPVCVRTQTGPRRGRFPKPSFPAFLLSAFYAMLDEWHQTFVPVRTGSLWDVFLDAFGAAFVQGFLWLRSVKVKKKG